jgi:hypothetical protein
MSSLRDLRHFTNLEKMRLPPKICHPFWIYTILLILKGWYDYKKLN